MALLKRIKGSITAIIFGLILLAGSASLSWWNEGRTIRTKQSLEEALAAVYSSQTIDFVSPENEGKLIHICGPLTCAETLRDNDFGIQTKHIKLKRNVEMYQWVESKKKDSKAEEESTQYSYEKKWSKKWHDSEKFVDKVQHTNPVQMRYSTYQKAVKQAQLGAHFLSASQLKHLDDWAPLRVDKIKEGSSQALINSEGKPSTIYVGGGTLEAPQIGDMRIQFEVINKEDYSLVAKQTGVTFSPFETEKGTSIDLISKGRLTAEEMISKRQKRNNVLKWVFRILGLLGMVFGVRLLLSLITSLTNYIPVVRSIFNFGSKLIAAVVGTCLFCFVAGTAWIWYRPLVGITLLLLGVAAFLLFSQRGKSRVLS